ncbi:hypothetical protein G6F66_014708 [Rhizopus arrhizus]|nr:hypothetical protein G6F66_014708 [Rhizopus arrhizus]
MRTRPALLRSLPALPVLALLLAGCGNDHAPFYQGYVEGDYVYVASSEAGRLDALPVKRGQQRAIGRGDGADGRHRHWQAPA